MVYDQSMFRIGDCNVFALAVSNLIYVTEKLTHKSGRWIHVYLSKILTRSIHIYLYHTLKGILKLSQKWTRAEVKGKRNKIDSCRNK